MRTDIVTAFRALASGVDHDGRVILMIPRAAILSTALHTLYSINAALAFITMAILTSKPTPSERIVILSVLCWPAVIYSKPSVLASNTRISRCGIQSLRSNQAP